MHFLAITSLTAGVLAFIFIILSFLVIRQRWKHGVKLLDNGITDLQRTIRAHANFAENAPLTLILLLLAELARMPALLLILLAAGFVLGRIVHAYSLIAAEPKQTGYPYIRTIGMLLTFIPQGLLAAYLIYVAIAYLITT